MNDDVAQLDEKDSLLIQTAIDPMMFSALREKSKGSKLYAIIPEPTEAEKMLCMKENIQILRTTEPKRIMETIREDHERYTIDRRVVGFLGALPNIGLTQTLYALAHELNKSIHAGLLGLNAYDEGILEEGKASIDQLKPYLSEKDMKIDTLKNFILETPVPHLIGNRDLRMTYHYHPDEVAKLIELATELFQITILDLGSYPDTSLAAEGLDQSDIIFILTDGSMKASARYQKTYEQILKPLDIQDSQLVVVSIKNIVKYPNLTTIANIPELKGANLAVEAGKLLTTIEDPEYQNAIQGIAHLILSRYGLMSEVTATSEKRGFFGRKKP